MIPSNKVSSSQATASAAALVSTASTASDQVVQSSEIYFPDGELPAGWCAPPPVPRATPETIEAYSKMDDVDLRIIGYAGFRAWDVEYAGIYNREPLSPTTAVELPRMQPAEIFAKFDGCKDWLGIWTAKKTKRAAKFQRCDWADLFSPCRTEYSLPAAVLRSPVPLVGDPEIIQLRSTTGKIIRQTIQGRNCAVKICFSRPARYDTYWDGAKNPKKYDQVLLKQLNNEYDAYTAMPDQQAAGHIPEAYWSGHFGGSMNVGLILEFIDGGRVTDRADALSAARALQAIHSAGVVHGDVCLHNILMRANVDGKTEPRRAVWLDFRHARMRKAVASDEEWEALLTKDRDAMERVLETFPA